MTQVLTELGWAVTDLGDATPTVEPELSHPNSAVKNLDALVGWTRSLSQKALEMARSCDLPVFLGGDHSMSAGTISGVAQRTAELGKEQFVLWLDAHTDLHTLHTTASGNLHGTPVAYYTGQSGFEGLPPLAAPVNPRNVSMMGIRSVDPEEATGCRDRCSSR